MPAAIRKKDTSARFTALERGLPPRKPLPKPTFSPLSSAWLLRKYSHPRTHPTYTLYNALVKAFTAEPLYEGHISSERDPALRKIAERINDWPLDDWQQLDEIRNVLVMNTPAEHHWKLHEIGRMRELAILALARCPMVDPSLNTIMHSSIFSPGIGGYSVKDSYAWLVKYDRVGLHAIEKDTVMKLCCIFDSWYFLGLMIEDYVDRFCAFPPLEQMEEVEAKKKVYWHGTVWTMKEAFGLDRDLRNNGLTYFT